MRGLIWTAMLMAAGLGGCDYLGTHSNMDRSRGELIRGQGHSDSTGRKNVISAKAGSIYAAAVEFGESYDWKADSNYGNEPFNLVLFADGKRVLTIPSSSGVRPDTDSQRILDGDLYTDYVSGGETIVCKNGTELFRYGGREHIRGFLCENDIIYTLGQSEYGSGVTYRTDGKETFSSSSGYVIGDSGLYMDESVPTFCYASGERFFCVRDGVEESITMPPNVRTVYDFRSYSGETAAVLEVLVSRAIKPVIYKGGKTTTLSAGKYSLKSCRLLELGGELYVKAEMYLSGKYSGTGLWNKDGTQIMALSGGTKALVFRYLGRKYAHVDIGGQGYVTNVADFGYIIPCADSMKIMSPGCVGVKNGRLAFALTPYSKTGSPYVQCGNDRQNILVNGYISCIGIKGQ